LTVSIGRPVESATDSTDWRINGTGDFSGDGKADLLWNHQTTNQNALWQFNGSAFLSADYLTPIAPGWTVAAIGDFDGDGKADLAWRNTSTGENAVWLMNGAAIASGLYSPRDRPNMADY
jgi:hypothetical protein